MAAFGEKLFHLRIYRLRLVAETEEYFRAAEQFALPHNAQYLIERHRFRSRLIRRFAKGAITAKIPAKIRQRHKNLRREGHYFTLVPIAQLGRGRQQRPQLIALCGRKPERFGTPELFALQTIS